MNDRLTEIRARLDASSKSAVRSWEQWPTYDDLRMREPFPTNEQAALAAHAPADIAWLLDELTRERADHAADVQDIYDLRDQVNALWDIVYEQDVPGVMDLYGKRVEEHRRTRRGR